MSRGVSKYDQGHANLVSFLVSDWTAKLDFSIPAHTIKLSLIPIIVSWPASWDVFMDSLQIIMCQTGHCGRLLCGLRSCLCSYIVSESSAVQQKTVWWILSEKFTTEVHSFGPRTERVCMCCCCSDRPHVGHRDKVKKVWKPENCNSRSHFSYLFDCLWCFHTSCWTLLLSQSISIRQTQCDIHAEHNPNRQASFFLLNIQTKPPSLCFIAATELVVCYSDMKVLALHECEIVTLIDPHHHVVLKHSLSKSHLQNNNSNPRLWERTRHIRSHHDVCNHGTKEKCPQTHCVGHLILSLCYSGTATHITVWAHIITTVVTIFQTVSFEPCGSLYSSCSLLSLLFWAPFFSLLAQHEIKCCCIRQNCHMVDVSRSAGILPNSQAKFFEDLIVWGPGSKFRRYQYYISQHASVPSQLSWIGVYFNQCRVK